VFTLQFSLGGLHELLHVKWLNQCTQNAICKRLLLSSGHTELTFLLLPLDGAFILLTCLTPQGFWVSDPWKKNTHQPVLWIDRNPPQNHWILSINYEWVISALGIGYETSSQLDKKEEAGLVKPHEMRRQEVVFFSSEIWFLLGRPYKRISSWGGVYWMNQECGFWRKDNKTLSSEKEG
jgi:hypothetical protein